MLSGLFTFPQGEEEKTTNSMIKFQAGIETSVGKRVATVGRGSRQGEGERGEQAPKCGSLAACRDGPLFEILDTKRTPQTLQR